MSHLFGRDVACYVLQVGPRTRRSKVVSTTDGFFFSLSRLFAVSPSNQLLFHYPRHCTFQIRAFWHPCCIASRQMLPTSHHAPMNLPPGAVKGPLAEAFKAFMATADRMEASYSQLQSEVARLRRERE